MKKQFCQYCGGSLEDQCECERIAAEDMAQFIDDYEDGHEAHAAWAQQDVIDLYRFER